LITSTTQVQDHTYLDYRSDSKTLNDMKMTKTNRILSVFLGLAVLTFATSGCKKYFEDYVATPNNPTEVTPALLLASVEVSTFASYGGQLARQSGVMIQHVAGTSTGSQTIEIANYNITELTNINEWSGIYEGALMDANIIINEYGGENPYYAGISRILIALNVGLASDLWGDVPLSDASGGQTGNLNPLYDAQESVFQQIQTLCDQAIVDLSRPEGDNTLVPGTDDFIHGGDVDAWIKTANVVKARYYNRLSKRDASGSATNALNALSAGAYTSSADDANLIYGEGNALNQWYAFEQSRGGYIRVSATFVDSLTNTSDPRLPVFCAEDQQGGYSGTPYDDVDMDTSSYVGAYYASATSPIPLVSYVEQKFIEAEAEFRAGNPGPAATAYNDAVKASILQVTGAADPNYEGIYASEDGGSISLEKIMYQKWVALFIQCEAYADWRRTKLPVLTPNPNGNTNVIPERFIYSQEERLYNQNFPGALSLTDPVWFAQ
jgi:hypothetical protein